ncbi:uncharacterized protein LOC143245068 isoform X2 [Tachypleus tridentatus]|uniref:uncharacterized protein LOC143245068 isoform X2 n=1 Tax=Tachypleus tridentatus TaxID=6853 RepID=UPI003FD577ED
MKEKLKGRVPYQHIQLCALYIRSEEVKVNGNSEPEDVDLEEGEILDDSEQETSFEAPAAGASGEHIQKKEVTGCESKLELEQLEPYVGETKDNSNKNKKRKKKKTKLVNDIDPLELEAIIKSKSKKQKKKHSYYVDHDRVTDSDPWFERSLSPNCSPTYYRSVRDYRHEYDDQYRGTYGSPGPYDSACNSPSYIRSPYQSPSPFTDYSCNEESDGHNERVSKSHHNISHNQRKSVKRHLVTERGRRKRKVNGFRGGPENKKSRKVKKVKRENWKQLCKFYMEGKCHKGADCPYLHDVTPPKKKELCKFYIHGFCAKGEKCLYMHKDFPCKFFHTGAKCYAENNCIFSHDPLTDETKKILDKYLEGTRADEDDKDDAGGDVIRGSERGRSPLKKRPSLLGSPPRHVKEQAESWRQEVQQQQLQHRLKNQMLHQQRQQFSNGGILSPPRNSRERLNFYTDTLQSPKKSSRVMQATSGKSTGLLKPPSSMSPRRESEEAAKFDRCISSGYQSKLCSTSWFKQEDQKYSLHDLSETEREGSLLSPKHEPYDSERSLSKYVNETSKVKEQEEIKEQMKEGSPVYNTDEETSMAPLSASPPSDTSSSQGVTNLICIPTHLPRRQKQLFLRIQQQQKEVGENGTEASEEQDSKPEEGISEKEEEEKVEGKIAEWDSSDDDDDTEDQPLTAVLKKLQQMVYIIL